MRSSWLDDEPQVQAKPQRAAGYEHAVRSHQLRQEALRRWQAGESTAWNEWHQRRNAVIQQAIEETKALQEQIVQERLESECPQIDSIYVTATNKARKQYDRDQRNAVQGVPSEYVALYAWDEELIPF